MTISTAYIFYSDRKICKVIYHEYDESNFEYVFQPDYEEIKGLENFRGIQGLNLKLHKEEYVRRNMLPTFIFEHTPLAGKKDFYKANRINNLTLLEYLAQSEMKYFGDNLSLRLL